MGFNNNNELLLDGIFYKFSYPGTFFPLIDPRHYNGDTLYYGYGIVDIAYDKEIGIKNTSGIPGESGSSLIKVNNETDYITYGVLSLSNDLRHNRITNEIYYAFKSIIEKDLQPTGIGVPQIGECLIYPNPASDRITVSSNNNLIINKVTLYNSTGNKVLEKRNDNTWIEINISHLSVGFYISDIKCGNHQIVKKIIINR